MKEFKGRKYEDSVFVWEDRSLVEVGNELLGAIVIDADGNEMVLLKHTKMLEVYLVVAVGDDILVSKFNSYKLDKAIKKVIKMLENGEEV